MYMIVQIFLAHFSIMGNTKVEGALLNRSIKQNQKQTNLICTSLQQQKHFIHYFVCTWQNIFFRRSNKPMEYNLVRKINCSTPFKIATKYIFSEIFLYVHCTQYSIQKKE